MPHVETKSIRLPDELDETIYALAVKEHRTWSQMIRVLLEEALAAREGR